MPDNLFWDILDEKRKQILPLFARFKSDFYLAGGTALALQLGHRDSIDFDFFTDKSFSTVELFKKVEDVFQGHKILRTQDKKDTLTLMIDDSIKISFFAYPYKLIKPAIATEYLQIAAIEDIACMKLSAITSRTANKDYVDLYFILQKYSLSELLDYAKTKFPALDTNLILKSMVYFDDIIEEPISYKHEHQIEFDVAKSCLENAVKEYLSKGKL